MARAKTQNFLRAASRMVTDPAFGDTLDELDLKGTVRNIASQDAKAYLQSKGIQLPEEAEVTIRPDNWSIELCAFGVCVTFTY